MAAHDFMNQGRAATPEEDVGSEWEIITSGQRSGGCWGPEDRHWHARSSGHDLSTSLLSYCLCRGSSNSRPKSGKSTTTCSPTKSKTAKGAPEEGLRTGNEDPGEKVGKEKGVPM